MREENLNLIDTYYLFVVFLYLSFFSLLQSAYKEPASFQQNYRLSKRIGPIVFNPIPTSRWKIRLSIFFSMIMYLIIFIKFFDIFKQKHKVTFI